MKAMKGKFVKKLKSMRPIGYLKQDRVLQVSASDGFNDSFPSNSNSEFHTQLSCKESEQKKIYPNNVIILQEPDIIDVTELMKDLEKEEMDLYDNKENIGPKKKAKSPISSKRKSEIETSKHTPLAEIDISCFRRPELNSGSLFDPDLLAAFEKAVKEHMQTHETGQTDLEKIEENDNSLLLFEEKTPPKGQESVILYTTSLRGIRKTFEDCSSVRYLLESFRVLFYERDISMHSEFREELWRVLGGKLVPPRLFIKGRYIGGAEEVLTLHEQGKLRRLFDGIPSVGSAGNCEGCAGVRFLMCFKCSGSRKLIVDEGNTHGVSVQCSECNENGLIVCPICC